MINYDLRGYNNLNLDQYSKFEKFDPVVTTEKPKIGLGQICSNDDECQSGLCTNYYGSGWNIYQNDKLIQESPDTKRCAEICNDNQLISNCYSINSNCMKFYPDKKSTQFKCVGKEACNNKGIPTCWGDDCINCKCDNPYLNGPIGKFNCYTQTISTTTTKANNNCTKTNVKKSGGINNEDISIDKLKIPIGINLNVDYNNMSGMDKKNIGKAPMTVKARKVVKANYNPLGKKQPIQQNPSIFDRMTQMASFMS